MSLKGIAKSTLVILEQGFYTTPNGKLVNLKAVQQHAVSHTVLYTPERLRALRTQTTDFHVGCHTKITVCAEKTQAAAYRLVKQENYKDLVLLNFASARNPGGGFLGGAKAQEEDLCRCSGLYNCLLTQPAFYEANRQQKDLFYSNNIIYSPQVPWFRFDNRDMLDDYYLASVITVPAPNAGEILQRQPNAQPQIESLLRYRAGLILAVAKQHKHEHLLLGAWGCGVFRNQPLLVADAFAQWLTHPEFKNVFNSVCFAVYDTSPQQTTLKAFQQCFSSIK